MKSVGASVGVWWVGVLVISGFCTAVEAPQWFVISLSFAWYLIVSGLIYPLIKKVNK